MERIKKLFNSNIFKFILVCLVFYYGKYTQYIPIFLFNIKKRTITISLLLSLFSNMVEFLFLICFFRKDLKMDFCKFKKNIRLNLDTGLKFWIIGVFLMYFSNMLISAIFHGMNSQNEVMVQNMINSMPWIMFINTAIVGPVIEEMVFRKGFRLIIKNKWAFVLISGFVFGFMHVIFSFSNIYEFLFVFPYAFVGCSYALSYYETDTIFTPITMHMLHNGILTLISIL